MIFFVLLLPLLVFAQDFSERSLTLGSRTSFFTHHEEFDNSFLYVIPEYADETFGESVSIRRKFKLRVFDYVSSNEEVIIDPLDVSLEIFTNKNSFQIGFLRYRFSETFGLQLLDVANPRDYSEFIFNDLSWSKRSVFGMNDTFKIDNLQVQLMLTLWPNGDRLPYQDSAFDPTSSPVHYQGGVVDRPWFKDLEYGTRLKYLFENGLDLSLLYYHHFTRPTFQDVKINGPLNVTTNSTDKLVDSLGSSASFVYEEWVLRGDVLFTFDDYVQKDLLSYDNENHFQSLFGIDRTFKNFLLGFQTQSDYTVSRHYFGMRSEWTQFSWWKPSLMIYRNYKSADQWFQLKSLFELESWKLEVTYDNIHGGKDKSDLFGFYRQNDRFLIDLSYTY